MVLPFKADVSDIHEMKPRSVRVGSYRSRVFSFHDHSLDRSGFMEMH